MARLFTGLETIDNWSPLDGVPAPEYVPLQWTGPHVARRLADAWRVLSRMPWRSPYPRSFGRWWPSYRVEWTDVLAMIDAGELEAMQREANRVRGAAIGPANLTNGTGDRLADGLPGRAAPSADCQCCFTCDVVRWRPSP